LTSTTVIATLVGAIVGGILGGYIAYMVLRHATRDLKNEIPLTLRIAAYTIGGILLGVPGGVITEVIIHAVEK